MDEQRQGAEPLGRISGFAENVGKWGAALAAIALGVRFLYDFVFWRSVDSRILTYYVIADHIETAIDLIAGILFAALLGLLAVMALVTTSLVLSKVAKRVRWALAAVIVAVLVLFLWNAGTLAALVTPGLTSADGRPFIDDQSVNAVRLILILLGLTSIASVIRSAVSPDAGMTHLKRFLGNRLWYGYLAALVLFIPVFTASLHAQELRREKHFVDVVTVEEGPEMSGRIVRSLDRGLVLYLPSDHSLIFVPKEHVRKVRHSVVIADTKS